MRLKALYLAITALALAPSLASCKAQSQEAAQSEREDIKYFEGDDSEMNAAKAKAQETLPEFLAILANPKAGTDMIGFKYPLGGAEHIWVDNVKRDGDYLTGNLNNVPMLEGYAQGDAVKVPLKEVSDWAAMVDGKMQGQYTTRVILKTLPPQDADAIKEQFGWN